MMDGPHLPLECSSTAPHPSLFQISFESHFRRCPKDITVACRMNSWWEKASGCLAMCANLYLISLRDSFLSIICAFLHFCASIRDILFKWGKIMLKTFRQLSLAGSLSSTLLNIRWVPLCAFDPDYSKMRPCISQPWHKQAFLCLIFGNPFLIKHLELTRLEVNTSCNCEVRMCSAQICSATHWNTYTNTHKELRWHPFHVVRHSTYVHWKLSV